MNVKGAARTGVGLSSYLMTKGQNEDIQFMFVEGSTHPDDIHKSIAEWHQYGKELSKGDKTVYHAQISPGKNESGQMTDEQWIRSYKILGEKLGLENQPGGMVKHFKEGRWHAHAFWSRYDMDKKRLISDSKNYYRQTEARLQMEKEFGHAPTRKIDPMNKVVQHEAMAAWMSTRTGSDFVRDMDERGFIVARTNRQRPFVVIDKVTDTDYELTRKLKDRSTETYIQAKEVWKRFEGLELPDQKLAIKAIREQQHSEPARKKREFKEQWERSKQNRSKDRGPTL